jgi:type IV pilus assembly protein PilE
MQYTAGGPARRGFTLIELMIALAVLAIVASLAAPAYFDYVRKGRRSEAFAALAQVQQAQERRRANTPTYTEDMAQLAQPGTTPSGYYTIALSGSSATGFTATATAAGGQAKDERCYTLSVQAAGGNVLYGSACKVCTMANPPTDPNRCWNRQ